MRRLAWMFVRKAKEEQLGIFLIRFACDATGTNLGQFGSAPAFDDNDPEWASSGQC